MNSTWNREGIFHNKKRNCNLTPGNQGLTQEQQGLNALCLCHSSIPPSQVTISFWLWMITNWPVPSPLPRVIFNLDITAFFGLKGAAEALLILQISDSTACEYIWDEGVASWGFFVASFCKHGRHEATEDGKCLYWAMVGRTLILALSERAQMCPSSSFFLLPHPLS